MTGTNFSSGDITGQRSANISRMQRLQEVAGGKSELFDPGCYQDFAAPLRGTSVKQPVTTNQMAAAECVCEMPVADKSMMITVDLIVKHQLSGSHQVMDRWPLQAQT